MQIDILVTVLPPFIDGVGDYTWALAHALRLAKVNVRIITDVRLKESLKQYSWVLPIVKEWNYEGVREAIIEANRLAKADWLLVQFVPQAYNRYGIAFYIPKILRFAKTQSNVRCAVMFHEFVSSWGLSPKRIFFALITRIQTVMIFKNCDKVFTTCKRYQKKLLLYCLNTKKIAYIPVGATIPVDQAAGDEIQKLKRETFSDDALVFSTLGRLYEKKNLSLALDCLAMARRKNVPAFLCVIGCAQKSHPQLFESFMRQVESLELTSYVVVTGSVSAQQASQYLQMTDVFLFPQDGGVCTRSTVLMNALSHGLTTIAFEPHPGNFEEYPLSSAMRLAHNADQFVNVSFDALCEQSEKKAPAGGQLKEYWKRYFSWEQISQLYLKEIS